MRAAACPCGTEASIRHFPAFLDLRGRRALVLGAGEAAQRKAQALIRAGAIATVAPAFDPALLAGCAIAVGADAPEAELAALSRAAQAAGIPVNVVDRPALCSFITPAIVDRDPITVAISSAGAAPLLARDIRTRIEALLPPDLGRLARLLDTLKAELRAAFPDAPARRRMIERLLAGPAARLALAGEDEAALAAARGEMALAEAPPGTVHLVGAGPGAADLLTLRAQRLLGQADVIVHDRSVGAAVLDMARRDARRIDLEPRRAMPAATGALLVALARDGNRVVRLAAGDPRRCGPLDDELAALRQAGVAHEVVPGVAADPAR